MDCLAWLDVLCLWEKWGLSNDLRCVCGSFVDSHGSRLCKEVFESTSMNRGQGGSQKSPHLRTYIFMQKQTSTLESLEAAFPSARVSAVPCARDPLGTCQNYHANALFDLFLEFSNKRCSSLRSTPNSLTCISWTHISTCRRRSGRETLFDHSSVVLCGRRVSIGDDEIQNLSVLPGMVPH